MARNLKTFLAGMLLGCALLVINQGIPRVSLKKPHCITDIECCTQAGDC